MTSHRISATRAARSFAEILNRVKYRGESFIVERNREPMCRIEPVRRRKPATTDNFAEFWKSLPRPDEKFADELEEVHNTGGVPLRPSIGARARTDMGWFG